MDSGHRQELPQPVVHLQDPARVDVHRTYLFTADVRLGRIAGLKPSDFLLMMVIKSHVGRYNGEAAIGTRLLAAQSGLGRSTVFECIKRLVNAGFIEYEPSQRERGIFAVIDNIPIKIGHKRVGVMRCVFTPQRLNEQIESVKRVLFDAKESVKEGQDAIEAMALALIKFSTQEQGRFIRAFGFDEGGETKLFAAASSQTSRDFAEANKEHVKQTLSRYRASDPPEKVTLALPHIEIIEEIPADSVVAELQV